jgi:hypothetical protein
LADHKTVAEGVHTVAVALGVSDIAVEVVRIVVGEQLDLEVENKIAEPEAAVDIVAHKLAVDIVV